MVRYAGVNEQGQAQYYAQFVLGEDGKRRIEVEVRVEACVRGPGHLRPKLSRGLEKAVVGPDDVVRRDDIALDRPPHEPGGGIRIR
jgi:hypothetical protein